MERATLKEILLAKNPATRLTGAGQNGGGNLSLSRDLFCTACFCDRPVDQPLSSCLEEPSGYRGQPYFEAVRAACLHTTVFVCLRGHLCAAYESRTAVPPVPRWGLRQISLPAGPNAPFFRARL